MKILTIGFGAFGFAVSKYLSKKDYINIFAFDLNFENVKKFETTKIHHFFQKNNSIPENISFLKSLPEDFGEFQIIIISISAQFVKSFLVENISKFSEKNIILNLSKGINFHEKKTNYEIFKSLNISANYAVLSGGMIAEDLLSDKIIGCDLTLDNSKTFKKNDNFSSKNCILKYSETTSEGQIKKIKETFSGNLDIKILENKCKELELFGAIKNIFSLGVGYLNGKGKTSSEIGNFVVNLISETKIILEKYFDVKNPDFLSNSFLGDFITSAFGNSRNAKFGKEFAENSQLEAKYLVEGIPTLKAIKEIVGDFSEFPNYDFLIKTFKV